MWENSEEFVAIKVDILPLAKRKDEPTKRLGRGPIFRVGNDVLSSTITQR